MKHGSIWRKIAAKLLCFAVIIAQSGFLALAEPLPGEDGTDDSVADNVYGTVEEAVYGDAPLMSLFSLEGLPELHGFGRNSMGQLALNNNGSDQLTPELVTAFPGLNIVDIAAGLNHTVVLTEDGEVYAVGANNKGQLGDGTNKSNGAPVAVNLSGVDGEVVSIAAGDTHTLLLTDQGKVYGFGNTSYGELGFTNEAGYVALPTLLSVAGEVASIEANYYTTFLVTTDGEVYAAGRNLYGQLGVGLADTGGDLLTFKKVSGLAPEAKVKSVSAGSTFTLFVMEDGSLYAAGSVPAVSGYEFWVEPTPVTDFADEFVVSAAAGSSHALVLTADGRVFVFGQRQYGQLGLDPATIEWETLSPRELPDALFGGEKAVAVAAGNTFSLVLTESRKVFSFGQDIYSGQGIDTDNDVTLPAEITPAGTQVTKIAAKRFHSLLLTLGPSMFDYPDPPADIAVTPGHRHLTVSFTPPAYDGGTPVTEYTVHVWNDKENYWKTGAESPIVVDNLKNAVAYKVTVKSTNARGTSRESAPPIEAMPGHPAVPGLGLFALGDNSSGQLGFGDYDDRGIPELIPGFAAPLVFASGEFHTLVASGGELYVFGAGGNGRLGLGNDRAEKPSPTVNPAFSDGSKQIAALSGGDHHSLVVTTSGELYGFGKNKWSQLGDPSLGEEVLEPTPIMEDVKVVDAAAGTENFTCPVGGRGSIQARVGGHPPGEDRERLAGG